MAISRRDLEKVAGVPEVKAAIEARDQAAEASRAAYRAYMDADRALDQRNAELNEIAGKALEAWRREV